MLLYWKKVLEYQYPETRFYVFASYDNGDMLILDEGELPTRSVTLRFWADRGTDTVINLDFFDDWEQPAIVGYCNFAPPNLKWGCNCIKIRVSFQKRNKLCLKDKACFFSTKSVRWTE